MRSVLKVASSLDEEGLQGSTGEQRQNCCPTLLLSSGVEEGQEEEGEGGAGACGGQRNKKTDIRSTVRRFFTGRIGGGGQIWPASTHVCLIRLGPFLWENSEEGVGLGVWGGVGAKSPCIPRWEQCSLVPP